MTDVAGGSPIESLTGLENVYRTRFGAFTVVQVQTLLRYCATATDEWCPNQRHPRQGNSPNRSTKAVTGPQRALLYQFACETALRANVIRSVIERLMEP